MKREHVIVTVPAELWLTIEVGEGEDITAKVAEAAVPVRPGYKGPAA